MLIDRLEAHAASTPDQPVFTWVDDKGHDEATLSCRGLRDRVATLSGYLTGPCRLRRGDRVLLVYPPSMAFIESFLACLYAGLVPVPCYPPDPRDSREVARIGLLASEAATRVALCNAQFRWAMRLSSVSTLLSRERPVWPELSWHTTDAVKTGAFAARRQPGGLDDVALLQFTSGSTSSPRGVALRFANLEHQLALNARVLELDQRTRAVLWVPQYHDLGLISGILNAVYGNHHLYMLSPLSFLSRPAVWAEVLTRTRATHTASPHFGYSLLLRKTTPEQRARFDLSALRILMSAGEPIHQQTMERFFEAFAVSRLSRDAWCPAYGLAEHTVGVTMRGRAVLRADRLLLERRGRYRPAPSREGADSITLVGCGLAEPDVVVRIVDPETRVALPDGTVGEIWVDSPSRASAYFNHPEESAERLHARLAAPDDSRRYLRTGDLGLRYDGELFITGRLKDLIIIAGRNLAAIDLEEIVRGVGLPLRPGGLAAVAVPDASGDTESVGLVLEAATTSLDEAEAQAIAVAARDAVQSQLRIPVGVVVIGRPGLVPKTTSGKPRRSACRAALLDGTLERQAEHRFRFDFDAQELAAKKSEPPSLSQQDLAERLGELPLHERFDGVLTVLQEAVAVALGRPDAHAFDPYAPLASFGIDSLLLVEFSDQLSDRFAARLFPAVLAAFPNLASLAAHLLENVLHLPYLRIEARDASPERPRSRLREPSWRPETSARIAIVGAGCGGLSSAWELAQRGFRNVTIFESLPRVGGKVHTSSHDGIDFELGQLYFSQQGHTIWRLALEVGCEPVARPGTNRLRTASGASIDIQATPAIRNFYDAVRSAAERELGHSGYGSTEEIPEVQLMPLAAWLARHGLTMPPTVLAAWTACGYGYLSDEVPAWYFLRHGRQSPVVGVLPYTLRGGNQTLWNRTARQLYERHGHTLRLAAPVTRYEASDEGVRLTVAGQDPEPFDAVIFALPAHALAPLLPTDEREPFQRFRHYAYRVTAFTAEELPATLRTIQFAASQPTPLPGEVLGIWSVHERRSGFVGGQYINRPGEATVSDAELDAKLHEQLTRLGVRSAVTVATERWLHYFPHLSARDLRAGTLQAIESRQGHKRTFYTGSYLTFETLEHVARHAESIVDAFFGPDRREPQPSLRRSES